MNRKSIFKRKTIFIVLVALNLLMGWGSYYYGKYSTEKKSVQRGLFYHNHPFATMALVGVGGLILKVVNFAAMSLFCKYWYKKLLTLCDGMAVEITRQVLKGLGKGAPLVP